MGFFANGLLRNPVSSQVLCFNLETIIYSEADFEAVDWLANALSSQSQSVVLRGDAIEVYHCGSRIHGPRLVCWRLVFRWHYRIPHTWRAH
jgi:hypothetical protein